MKRISLGAAYELGLLTILFLIVLHAPLTVLLGTILPEQQMILKAWKEIALAGISVLGAVLITRQNRWGMLLRAPLTLLVLAYVGLHLLLALVIGGESTSVIGGLLIDLRFLAMCLLMQVLIILRPQALSRVFKTALAGAGIVTLFGFLQITVLPDDILSHIGYSKNETIAPFITIDSNTDYVRINSTLRGPNPLGAVMVIYISLATAYLLYRYKTMSIRRRCLLVAGTLIGVAVLFASYSRSAYLALAASLGSLMLVGRQYSKRVILSSVVVAAGFAGILLLTSQTDWFSNVILHEDPESSVETKSNDEHLKSLATGWQRMVSEPFGHGVGSTGSASLYDESKANDIIIENYYFFVAHEAGWLGLVLFLGLFGYVLLGLWRRRSDWKAYGLLASGIGMAIIALLLPVWTDETVALIWWGLAGAVLASKLDVEKVQRRKVPLPRSRK